MMVRKGLRGKKGSSQQWVGERKRSESHQNILYIHIYIKLSKTMLMKHNLKIHATQVQNIKQQNLKMGEGPE